MVQRLFEYLRLHWQNQGPLSLLYPDICGLSVRVSALHGLHPVSYQHTLYAEEAGQNQSGTYLQQ
jgi:hypothetical protein